MLMLFLYFLLKENLPESNVKSVEGQLSGQGIIQNENDENLGLKDVIFFKLTIMMHIFS